MAGIATLLQTLGDVNVAALLTLRLRLECGRR